MSGKRFGAGIIGGLLVGLLVIASTGLGTAGLFGTLSTASNPNHGVMTSTTSTGQGQNLGGTTTTTATATTPSSATNSSHPPAGNYTTSEISTTTAQSTNANPVAFAVIFNGGAQAASASPSRVDSILAQPAVTDGIVLSPVLVALLLGALFYRASAVRRAEEDGEEQQP